MTPKESLDFLVKNLPTEAQQTTSIYHPAIRVLLQSIIELERLKKFKETFDNYELAKKQGFIAYEIWQECERELAELKCDVKRYFDLANEEVATKEVIDEFSKLRNKLLEVGKEEKENETN